MTGADPTFLVIGAPKCGTTSLWLCLREHPDVCMSQPKEPFYFDSEYGRGWDYYLRTYFSHWDGEHAVGDASTRNLHLPYVPARIRERLPDARLIAMLRNPTDRAFAHWWMEHSTGRDPLPFREAIEHNAASLASGRSFDGEAGERLWSQHVADHLAGRTGERIYLDYGYYAEQLQRYFEIFPREQIQVVMMEELRDDPAGLLERLSRFIGVDAEVRLASQPARGQNLGPLGSRLREMTRGSVLERYVPTSAKKGLRRILKRLGDRRPGIDDRDRQWLIEHFAAHNRALGSLLGLDLSHWDT